MVVATYMIQIFPETRDYHLSFELLYSIEHRTQNLGKMSKHGTSLLNSLAGKHTVQCQNGSKRVKVYTMVVPISIALIPMQR